MSIPKAVFPSRLADADPATALVRRFAAAGLSAASVVLARLAASQVEPTAAPADDSPRLEFHAVDGAAGGALYLDGEWVGFLPGVRRL